MYRLPINWVTGTAGWWCEGGFLAGCISFTRTGGGTLCKGMEGELLATGVRGRVSGDR